MQMMHETKPNSLPGEQSGCRSAAPESEVAGRVKTTAAGADQRGVGDPGQDRTDKQQKGALFQRKAAKKIEPSVAYMMEHLGEPLQVSQLASLCGLAPAQFFKLFKCATGHAPIDFFIRARMRRACELLKDPARKVKEVGALLGYNDRFYFSRVFKLVNGVAPSEYRYTTASLPRAEQPGATALWESTVAGKLSPDQIPSAPNGSEAAGNPL